MNPQIIKTFLTIAERGSMAEAAKELHFSQQVVSEHLKMLERELGAQLLLRSKGSRSIALTRDGSDFLPLARSWVEFQEQFEEKLGQYIRSRGRGVFRLAASSSAHQYIISHIVRKLMPIFPEIELRLNVVEINEMPEAIANQSFDAAFMFETVPASPSITAIPLFTEERCILCPANSALPSRTITVNELPIGHEVIYTSTIQNDAYNEWRRLYLSEGNELHLKTNSLMSIANYLLDPRSWAVLPMSMALEFLSRSPDKLSIRHVVPAPAPRSFSLLVAKNYPEKNVIRELLNCCEEYISERPHLQRILVIPPEYT